MNAATQSPPEVHGLDDSTRFAALATGAVVFGCCSAAMALLTQSIPNNPDANMIGNIGAAGGIFYAVYLAREASKIYKNRT